MFIPIDGVFRIRYRGATGTVSLYHTAKGCCFVTAKHVLEGCKTGYSVELQKDSGWVSILISEIQESPTHDVCAFATEDFGIMSPQPPFDDPYARPGCEVMFAGFPHDLVNAYLSQGFPTALIRGARFSGVINMNGNDIVILDGFNNPGYSGSLAYAPSKNGTPVVLEVVSGYRPEHPSHGQVYRFDHSGKISTVPDLFVRPNSGMILVSNLKSLKECTNKLSRFLPVNPASTRTNSQ